MTDTETTAVKRLPQPIETLFVLVNACFLGYLLFPGVVAASLLVIPCGILSAVAIGIALVRHRDPLMFRPASGRELLGVVALGTLDYLAVRFLTPMPGALRLAALAALVGLLVLALRAADADLRRRRVPAASTAALDG